MRIDQDAETDRSQALRARQCIRRLFELRRQTQDRAGRIEQNQMGRILKRPGIEFDERPHAGQHLHRIEIGEQTRQAVHPGERSRLARRVGIISRPATEAVSDQGTLWVDDRLTKQQGSRCSVHGRINCVVSETI